jgi:hypothetical protein
MRKAEDGTVSLVEDEEKKRVTSTANTELNFVSPLTLKLLRSKKVHLYFPSSYSKCEMNQYSVPHQSLIATFKSLRQQSAVRMAKRMTMMSRSRRKVWPWWRLLMQMMLQESRNHQHVSQCNLILPVHRQHYLVLSRPPCRRLQNGPQMRPLHKSIFQMFLSDSQRKNGFTGQIGLVRTWSYSGSLFE